MDKHSDSMKKYLDNGEKLAEEFPEESLNCLRKFREAALRNLGKRFDCESENPQITFSKLRKHIPARFYYYLEHIQSMGNYGSHFQEDGVDPSVEDARYCAYAGQEVLQWINPESFEDPVGKKDVFIGNIVDAVPCLHCEQPIGNDCVKKDGRPTATNCEHTIRKKAYAKYRRNFQKHYNTTIADAMHEMVTDVGLKTGEFIEPKEIRNWFDENYPAYTENAVNCHSMMMATNLKTRYSHPTSKNGNDKYNLFFAEKRKFRLYDMENDPTPGQFGIRPPPVAGSPEADKLDANPWQDDED